MKMLFVVVIIFMLSWLPLYAIFIRIKLGNEKIDEWEDCLLGYVTPMAQWLGSSNSCINPILYAFFNEKYRRGFRAIFESGSCCGPIRATAGSFEVRRGTSTEASRVPSISRVRSTNSHRTIKARDTTPCNNAAKTINHSEDGNKITSCT